jgi:GTPase
MSPTPIVSIVGRPNVGKSSLFNRIAGRRIAVVDDLPGVTRDRNYMTATWNGCDFIVVDTGGLLPNVHESLPDAIHEQVQIAIDESKVVLLLVDATTGVTDLDLLIAQQFKRRKASDKVLLVVNKSESAKNLYDIDAFRSLGVGDPWPVSALHGTGVADLLDRITALTGSAEAPGNPDESEPALRVAIIGRPNAGKSSLVNKLLGSHRMIVDSKPGTTRDAIDTMMVYEGRSVVLIDTAGLRKKSHVKQDMEYYANLRAMESISRCDICVALIDVTEGIGVQDLRIIRQVFEARKGLLLAWNKWDIMEKDHRTFDVLVKETRQQYMELRPVPMVSVSALSGQRVTVILDEVYKIKERMQTHPGASEFEDKVFEWARVHPHPLKPGKEVRFLGARQIGAAYPLFRFFVTNPEEVTPAYERYLMNQIHETYDFDGCPLVLEFRSASKPKHRAFSGKSAGGGEQEDNQ